jgi:hypothetical protein
MTSTLTGIFHLALHTDDPAAFEEAMTSDIMPSIEVLSRGVRMTSHHLVKLFQEYGAPQYRWSVNLEHFGHDEHIGTAIPEYFDEIRSEAADRLAQHVLLINFEMTSPITNPPLM